MKSDTRFDLIVIGGGVVGLSAAYKFQLKYPDQRILVLEKERELASHQTGRNSGVIHSGIYYKPGSVKAETCVSGRRQLVDFIQAYDVPHDLCGKIIVATTLEEVDQLDHIAERGRNNALEGITRLNPLQIGEIEPHVRGLAGLYVPQTGIVDYREFTRRLAERIHTINPRSEIRRGEGVRTFRHIPGGVVIHTGSGIYEADKLIGCAGLNSDRLARADGLRPDMKIVPFRGDYYELTPAAAHKVKNLIYPVPDPRFPFLGVHFTRMIKGGVECGPNAVFSFKREGYERTSFSLRDSAESLMYPGTWRLFSRHWRNGLEEYRRAFSKSLFLGALQKLIPDLKSGDITPARAGVRAQALNKTGALVDDFVIERGKRAIHVLNAPSPAATAALAIADRIVAGVEQL